MHRTPASILKSKRLLLLPAAALGVGLAWMTGMVEVLLPEAPFQKDIRPVLAQYCFKCHGPEKHKGDLDLTIFADEAAMEKSRSTWRKVWRMVQSHKMPPEDEPQPSIEQREQLTAYLDGFLKRQDCDGMPNPGRVAPHRLNRAEYAHTIRDLLGVAWTASEDFPSDEVGYGFDNIADVLALPPLLFEKYIQAADRALDLALELSPGASAPGPAPLVRLGSDDLDGGIPENEGGPCRILVDEGEVFAQVELPVEGLYDLRVWAWGDPALGIWPRMSLRVDGVEIQAFVVDAPRGGAPGAYQTQAKLTPGKHRISAAFLNDYYNPQNNQDRNLLIREVAITAPVPPQPAPSATPPSQAPPGVVFVKPGPDLPARDAAQRVLERFFSRAFRRPAQDQEVQRFLKLFDQAQGAGESFQVSLKPALLAVLVSPPFLFRIELDKPSEGPIRPLDGWELASRLSYFIWSSMPDEELFRVARSGDLVKAEVLEAQARRMLADPKAQDFVESFATQWLQIRRLARASPDPELFPKFNDELRQAMIQEAVAFFGAVLREDRPLFDLLDADFTYLNRTLADHYGLVGPAGELFERVSLTDGNRGGVLTMAAVLTATSHPTRTSPVKRGKWVLETLLGQEQPPPVPNAGELEDQPAQVASLSMRQRMELHRADPNCASCHRQMDPIGFGLENFDPIGAWRTSESGRPVDAGGDLGGGVTFQGPAQLKAILMGQKEEFARCLSEKMLTYALGRGLEEDDFCAVRDIQKGLKEDSWRLSRLVVEIVKSPPFRYREQEVVALPAGTAP